MKIAKKKDPTNPGPEWGFQERFHLTVSTPFAQANFGALSGRLQDVRGDIRAEIASH